MLALMNILAQVTPVVSDKGVGVGGSMLIGEEMREVYAGMLELGTPYAELTVR